MEFLKKVASEVFERVVKSYKSTLVGFGLACAVVALGAAGEQLAGVSAAWAPPVALVVQLIGAALKKKAAEFPMPDAAEV